MCSEDDGATPPSVSLRIGRIFATHVPGFWAPCLAELQLPAAAPDRTADGLGPHPQPVAEDGALDALPGSSGPAAAGDGAPSLPSLLAGGVSVDVAVSGLQLVALASDSLPAVAAVLDVGKVSGKLGGIRSSAAQTQGLTAALLRCPRGGPPAHGLRLAASGVQLSVAHHWPPASAAAAAAPAPAGVPEAVSSPLEVQLLVLARTALGATPLNGESKSLYAGRHLPDTGKGAAALPDGAYLGTPPTAAAAEGWALWCAVSPAAVHLSPRQLRAAAAVATGCGGQEVPSPGRAPPLHSRLPHAAAALGDVAVATSAVLLTFSPLGAAAVSAEEPHGLGAGTLHVAAEAAQVTVTAAQLSHGAAAAPGGGGVAASLHLAVHRINCCAGADEVAAAATLVEGGFGPQRAAVPVQLPVQLTGLRVAVGGSQRQASASAEVASNAGHPPPPQKVLRGSLRTASIALTLDELGEVARLAGVLSAGMSPPADAAATIAAAGGGGAGVDVDVEVDTLLVSLAAQAPRGAAPAHPLPAALCLAAAGLCLRQTASQVGDLGGAVSRCRGGCRLAIANVIESDGVHCA